MQSVICNWELKPILLCAGALQSGTTLGLGFRGSGFI